jgi:hypothetical protein
MKDGIKVVGTRGLLAYLLPVKYPNMLTVLWILQLKIHAKPKVVRQIDV